MAPSLLIVVPTLDSHLLLPRLLSSLQQQSWPHWRVLFIDGCSGPEHRDWLIHCCAREPRCRWLAQSPHERGIFGAMNQGFALAGPTDWLLFWGSDDWAAGPLCFEQVFSVIHGLSRWPDLLVCRGRYADATSMQLGRRASFQPAGLLNRSRYRRALLFGATPPHQATLFGPAVRRRLRRYADGFRLSADLDYFLQLARLPHLQVQCLDLELVHMADAGISGQQTQQRLREVCRAYRRAFGGLWCVPFVMRYWRRFISVLRLS